MFKFKYKLLDDNKDGAGNSSDTNDTSDKEKGTGNSDGNNGKDNIDDFSNLWHTDSNATTNTSDTTVINQQQSGNQLSPQDRLQAHIESKNMLDGVDYAALQNPETSSVELNKVVTGIYTATMQDASEIMTQQIDNLREELQQDTNDRLQGNKAIDQLNTALPYTSLPEFKPVVDGVFNRFLNQKDMTVSKAIELTGKYFNKLQGDVSKTMQQPPNNNLNGRQVFNRNTNANNGNSNGNNQSDITDKSDWISFLSAK